MTQSYSSLTGSKKTPGSIKGWANYSLFDSREILVEAEQWIYSRLRTEEMLAVGTGTMTAGTDTIAKPTRWRGAKTFRITGTDADKVELKTLEEVERNFQYDGTGGRIQEKPKMYYPLASSLQFEHAPDKAYPYRIVYYQALAPLTSQNETNALTERYPKLLRAACLLQAFEFMKDAKMMAYWMGQALQEIQNLHVEDDINRYSGVEADTRPE